MNVNDENTTLRAAATATGFITPEEFDKVVVPEKMVGNPQKDLANIILKQKPGT